jgi:hypothetical protein
VYASRVSWLDRLLGRKPRVPLVSWTDLPDELVEPFVARVILAVLDADPDERTSVNAATGTIELPDLGLTLDLRELAGRCRKLDLEAWAPLIAEQVARWLPPVVSPATLADAIPRIRIQLTNRDVDAAFCAREIATGLAGELCLTAGAGRRRIDAAMAAGWRATTDELWQHGLANLSADGARADTFTLDEPVSLAFHHAHGEHDLVASLALRLTALGDDAAHGWLFMVPHSRSLWYAPLHTLDQCAAGMLMFERAAAELRDALPLSTHVYWTDGTRFASIPRDGVRTGFELTDAITATVRNLTGAH